MIKTKKLTFAFCLIAIATLGINANVVFGSTYEVDAIYAIEEEQGDLEADCWEDFQRGAVEDRKTIIACTVEVYGVISHCKFIKDVVDQSWDGLNTCTRGDDPVD